MAYGLILLGLLSAFWGSLVLVRGELYVGAARIRWWRHYQLQQKTDKGLPGGRFRQLVFRAAERWGPKDPWAAQEYDAESFPEKVAGLGLLALGFVLQAAGVCADLLSKR